ncbi:MAG: circadian clock KaiB family protein [Desulfatiglandaceae bacterium]
MPSEATSKKKGVVFRLFVAGHEPHSRAAETNLRKLCESHISASVEIEIVDVLESHEMALKHRIFLTPAVMRVTPGPPVTIFGDLSDIRKVINTLRLEEGQP